MVGAVVLLALAALFAAVYAGPGTIRAARDGRDAIAAARDAFVARDAEAATERFLRAERLFSSAEQRLSSPLVSPARLVPVVNRHIVVGRSLALIGARVAEAGRAATAAMAVLPDRELKLEGGRVDLGAVRDAIGAFGGSVAAATDVAEELGDMPSGWLVEPLDRARAEALDVLPSAVDGMLKGQRALASMPSLFADGTTKRYLIAFSNLSELRGSGGFIGYVTVLRAEDGDLELEEVSGRPTELFPPPGESLVTFPEWLPSDLREQGGIFQNVNTSTDFPTAGHLIVETAEPAIGEVDGVIGIDPLGLAAILGATGPIEIPSWPERIDAANVSRVAQHDVYIRIQNNEAREDFFEELVRTTFDRLATLDVAFRPETFGTFDAAVRGGHLRMYSVHEEDQAAFTGLGLAGSAERAGGAGDVLSVVSQNAAGNKADWFLRREVRYRVALDPFSRTAASDLVVRMQNGAPRSGMPDYVIGSSVEELEEGTNRQNVTFVRDPDDVFRALEVDGRLVPAAGGAEGPLQGYRTTVDIPAGSSRDVRLVSIVPRALEGTGDELIYRLHVLPQPVVNPDFLEIDIEVPEGWRAEGRTSFAGALRGDLVLEVRVSQTTRAWLLEKVVLEPWRSVRALVGRIF